MVWGTFLGRFHPLLVHLPIGVFVLGFLFEIIYQLGFKKFIHSRKPIVITYILGLIFGICAAFTGWLLSLNGHYEFASLDSHKIVGIITLIVMLALIIFQIRLGENKGKQKLTLSFIAVIFIGITGHLGGNLTHGQNYLSEYAPRPFNSDISPENGLFDVSEPDSILIYKDIIQPILKSKCYGCHNSENNRGGLILENYSDLFKDENHDKPITPNDLRQSALYVRVSLPTNDKLLMPPRGDHFGYTNLNILKYWIENGADSLAKFNNENMSNELIMLLQRDYKLDFSYKPYYEKVKLDSLAPDTKKVLIDSGLKFNYLAENNYLLDISFTNDSIASEEISVLTKIANRITFLNLENSRLTDSLAKSLPPFPHLTRINLGKNKLSDEALQFLLEHIQLESINLNSTSVTHEFINKLVALRNLKRIYVADTEVKPEAFELLRKTYSHIDFISQFHFEKVEEAKSVFEQENSTVE